MKIIIQRVTSASVTVEQQVVAKIGKGILALVGFGQGDDNSKFNLIVDKILNFRIFANNQGRFDRSLLDTQGEIILVPQFTLYADTSKGRRPEFFNAMAPKEAALLFNEFYLSFLLAMPQGVQVGIFGADMQVELVNNGPVTIALEF